MVLDLGPINYSKMNATEIYELARRNGFSEWPGGSIKMSNCNKKIKSWPVHICNSVHKFLTHLVHHLTVFVFFLWIPHAPCNPYLMNSPFFSFLFLFSFFLFLFLFD